MADLVFNSGARAGSPTNLVFGDDASSAPPLVTAEVYAELDGVEISAVFAGTVEVEVFAELAGVEVAAVATYDNKVTRWLEGLTKAAHQVADDMDASTASGWDTALPARPEARVRWQPAAPVEASSAIVHETAAARAREAAARHELAAKVAVSRAAVHQHGLRTRRSAEGLWEEAVRVAQQRAFAFQHGIPANRQIADSDWQIARALGASRSAPFGPSRRVVGKQASVMPWQEARRPPNGRSVLPPVIVPPVYVGDADLLFQCPPIIGSPTHLVFGASPCYPPSTTIVVPIRSVYIVLNSASLRRVDGNIDIPIYGLTMRLDYESWTWVMNASCPLSVQASLEPATWGDPVEVEALLNGVPYRMVLKTPTRDRSFGAGGIAIECRGKASLLDSPYAPVQNFYAPTVRTAQQLMADVLRVNGVPLDWAIDWNIEDWLVPGGVFAHQGTFMSALNRIAEAAGAYIQPHASLQQMSVLARYPVMPNEWAGVTPDYELPVDVTTREGIQWVNKAGYNRVYVSGEAQGISAQVTRDGTDGAVLAPPVVDSLITAAAAGRQRGMAILGDTGPQALLALRLPVLAETGIIPPGKFVRYTDGGIVRIGLTRSVDVETNMPEIWQTLGVETHVA